MIGRILLIWLLFVVVLNGVLRQRVLIQRLEKRIGHESGERSDDMDEKDDETAHLSILARRLTPRNCVLNQQFAIDRKLDV